MLADSCCYVRSATSSATPAAPDTIVVEEPGRRNIALFDANPDMSRLIVADHAVFAGGTDELH